MMKTIKIEENLKKDLDNLKGKKTYNEIIRELLLNRTISLKLDLIIDLLKDSNKK